MLKPAFVETGTPQSLKNAIAILAPMFHSHYQRLLWFHLVFPWGNVSARAYATRARERSASTNLNRSRYLKPTGSGSHRLVHPPSRPTNRGQIVLDQVSSAVASSPPGGVGSTVLWEQDAASRLLGANSHSHNALQATSLFAGLRTMRVGGRLGSMQQAYEMDSNGLLHIPSELLCRVDV